MATGSPNFLRDRIEVVEGDVTQPRPRPRPGRPRPRFWQRRSTSSSIARALTDFNPDLRDALATRMSARRPTLLDLHSRMPIAQSSTTSLHLLRESASAMAVFSKSFPSNYTPGRNLADFDAEKEWAVPRSASSPRRKRAPNRPKSKSELRARKALKEHAAKDLSGAALEIQIRKNRVRWLRQALTDAATQRANDLGWPNTYTLHERASPRSLIRNFLDSHPKAASGNRAPRDRRDLPIEKPFLGWNEGINTSARHSLTTLGTFFRQLPTTGSEMPRPDPR